MKYILIALIALFPIFSQGADGRLENHVSIASANFEWYKTNIENIREVLLSGSDIEALPIVNTICSTWEFRDGAIGMEIAPMLAHSITHKTHLTLLWFSKNPAVFDEWLGEIPAVVFTDFDGTSSESLIVLREDLMASLATYIDSNKDGELVSLARKLLKRVEGIEITVID